MVYNHFSRQLINKLCSQQFISVIKPIPPTTSTTTQKVNKVLISEKKLSINYNIVTVGGNIHPDIFSGVDFSSYMYIYRLSEKNWGEEILK